MTSQEEQKLRAAGFSDDDIAAYKQNEAAPQVGVTPAVPSASGSQLPDTLPMPQATVNYPTAAPASQTGAMSGLVGAYNAANEFLGSPLGHLTEGALGLYGASKVGQAVGNAWRGTGLNEPVQQALQTAQQFVQNQSVSSDQLHDRELVRSGAMTPEQALARQQAREAAARVVTPTAPVQPAAPAAPGANAIQGAQTAQQGENWMAKAINMAKQVGPTLEQYGNRAAQAMAPVTEALAPVGRVMAPVARVLGSAPVLGAQIALTPSDTGPAVPTSGPYRGMEINPNTRRPWTAQEIQQANQMPMPMRR